MPLTFRGMCTTRRTSVRELFGLPMKDLPVGERGEREGGKGESGREKGESEREKGESGREGGDGGERRGREGENVHVEGGKKARRVFL